MDDTDLDVLRQGGHEGTSEPVGRCQTRVRTTEWGDRLAPLAHLPGRLRICGGVVNCGHPQESWTRTLQILCFRFGCTFHVGLSETEEDVEVGIWFLSVCRQTH